MNRLFFFVIAITIFTACNQKIDRYKVVSRHSVYLSQADPLNPLTVGNGKFAYTADITGMQTFPAYHEKSIPLGTFSDWGWHSFPNTGNYTPADVEKMYWNGTDSVPYLYQFSENDNMRKHEATRWLRENPHRMHLGLIGLQLLKENGDEAEPNDIQLPKQQLNLWTGELKSRFQFEGYPVEVTTFCHQETDQLAFKIQSPLIKKGKLKVKLTFPYPDREKFSSACDFNSPGLHNTKIVKANSTGLELCRELGSATYFTKAGWTGSASIIQDKKHRILISPNMKGNQFEISIKFSAEKDLSPLPSFSETENNNATNWEKLWNSGGAVDFSKCTDPRAFELERRVVLSQYLTKIQCTGPFPPQETGLTFNSWHGKFHLEMHWWHMVHFILWNRTGLIEKQLDYYFNIFDKARKMAKWQGYNGVRWPKMTDPAGNESPSSIGTFLIWQQPHIIYYTNLLYRAAGNDKSILRKYYPLVKATADFMAAYARWDSATSRYVLGPALIPAQERFRPDTTINPAFELAYWRYGLQTAQNHRLNLGLGQNETWQHVIDNLAPLPVKDSLYLFTEDAADSYENPHYLTDHPIVLAVGGFLPLNEKTDTAILKNTFNAILENWDWQTCWGWDFPLAALTATVLNEPEQAIDLLLMDTPKNRFLANGHNYQNQRLPLYLPGNGALLTAIVAMCTYQNGKGKNGFPQNGEWDVRYEHLNSLY